MSSRITPQAGGCRGALAFVASRATDDALPDARTEIVLDDDEQVARFLDALDNPAKFEAGLRRLMARADEQAVESR